MNKLFAAILLLTIGCDFVIAKDKQELPFVGEKVFNFYDNEMGKQFISIRKDGATKIIVYGGNSSDGAIAYKGSFSNPIKLKDGTGYLIKGDKIFLLDNVRNGHIQTGCIDDGKPCVSELWSEH